MKKRTLDRQMLSVIFALAWPTMLEELMQTAVQYIDTAMVGTLGTQATAAVGATGTVSWLVGSTVSAVGVGFLAYISQAFGAGEQERAKRASAQSCLAVLVLGVLLTLATVGLSNRIVVWMQVDPSSDRAPRPTSASSTFPCSSGQPVFSLPLCFGRWETHRPLCG